MKAIMLSIDPHEVVNIADKNYITKLIRKTVPKISTPFKVFLYCRNVLPYVVWGNVFKGNWETELTTLSRYNRKDAERIWDVVNGKVVGEFICDKITCYDSELYDDDDVYQAIRKRYEPEDFCEYGEYEYDTIVTNEDENSHNNLFFTRTNTDWDKLRYTVGEGYQTFYTYGVCHRDFYDCPVDISDFKVKRNNKLVNMTTPPRGWCYVEIEDDTELIEFIYMKYDKRR